MGSSEPDSGRQDRQEPRVVAGTDASVRTAGISADAVTEMSWARSEPDWMRDLRLNSLASFETLPLPTWGPDLRSIEFEGVRIPPPVESEPKGLAAGAYAAADPVDAASLDDSEKALVNHRQALVAQGVIFCDMNTALHHHPELVKLYFGTVVPIHDGKFSALNSAVWTGGSFIYVPPGVEVEMPLQAFDILEGNTGPFERTLIIADEGAQMDFIEGCSAPTYTADSLHAGVVEVVVRTAARVRYTTIQNWSTNVFNLVTKRAVVEELGHMEWIDGNIGSRLTMTYPGVVMVGPKASGEVLSMAYAGHRQHQHVGARMTHAAPQTTSRVLSKTVSKEGGRCSYRDLIQIEDGAPEARSDVQTDALLLDTESISDSFSTISPDTQASAASVDRRESVAKVAEQDLRDVMSRGLSQEEAMATVVNSFIGPVTQNLPMEYAIEWARLIELQIEGSIG